MKLFWLLTKRTEEISVKTIPSYRFIALKSIGFSYFHIRNKKAITDAVCTGQTEQDTSL